MEFQWFHYVACLVVGIVAGVINTLAGSGSLITLPMLMFLGLPANVANGTNRLGVLSTSIIGGSTYLKKEKLPKQQLPWLIIPALIGALIGAFIAVDINERVLYQVIGFLMIAMLIIVIVRPKKLLQSKTSEKIKTNKFLLVFWMFIIGVYGGFIQAGIGVFLIMTLVFVLKVSINQANLLKLLIVLIFTIPILFIFYFNQQINWMLGLLLAFGQGIGAYFAARFATSYPNADTWVRRLLILIIVVSIIKLFDVPTLLGL